MDMGFTAYILDGINDNREVQMNKTEALKQTFNLLEAEYGEQNNLKKEVWAKVLGNYPAQKIIDACIECIKTKKFFPRVSEMIVLIEGDIESEAELAWLLLKEKMDKVGYYKSVSFPENLVIGAVVEAMGGWLKMFDITVDGEVWVKKEFIKMYPILKKKGIYPDRLIGRFELDNTKAGYSEEYLLKRYGMHINGSRETRKRLPIPKSKRGEKADEVKLLKKE